MALSTINDRDFIRVFEERGATGTAKQIGMTLRSVYNRRKSVEARIGRRVKAPVHDLVRNMPDRLPLSSPAGRIIAEVQDGIVLVGSDCHYWPGPASLMHKAFVATCKELKPKIVVLNGDVLDFGMISRYPPIGWTHQPTPQEEIEAAQERLHEIEMACGKAQKIWPLGNHDARFETRLATVAHEFARISGSQLSDHFPLWSSCWSIWVNDTTVIKHRYKGGVNATRNNTLNAGLNIVTGHLHSSKVTPFTDYQGTRYGVDTGCIADPNHKAFLDYREDSPSDWRDGFCVLTFRNKVLMYPELVTRFSDNEVQFRGQITKI